MASPRRWRTRQSWLALHRKRAARAPWLGAAAAPPSSTWSRCSTSRPTCARVAGVTPRSERVATARSRRIWQRRWARASAAGGVVSGAGVAACSSSGACRSSRRQSAHHLRWSVVWNQTITGPSPRTGSKQGVVRRNAAQASWSRSSLSATPRPAPARDRTNGVSRRSTPAKKRSPARRSPPRQRARRSTSRTSSQGLCGERVFTGRSVRVAHLPDVTCHMKKFAQPREATSYSADIMRDMSSAVMCEAVRLLSLRLHVLALVW